MFAFLRESNSKSLIQRSMYPITGVRRMIPIRTRAIIVLLPIIVSP